MRSLGLLLTLALLLAGCPGDDDDTVASNDDDLFAVDDDDSATDDDDAVDDDDSTTTSTAPVVDDVDVCETQIVGTSYLRFSIDVSDPDGNLLNPVRYYLQYTNADTGGASPLLQFEVTEDMNSGGTITHLLEIGVDGLDRGVGFEFDWYVLDAEGQSSNTVTAGHFIASAPNPDC